MQKDESLKLLFVINPISGGKEKKDWEVQIREYCKDANYNTEFYLLTGKDDATSIEKYIEIVKPTRIVAVGGDGTVKMLAEMVQYTPIQLAIIPAGSANGMAKELDIPADIQAALDIAVNGEPTTIDTIKINDSEICIHLSDLGLNAMLVKHFEQTKTRGMWGYGQAIFKMLWHKRKMHCIFYMGEKTFKRHAYMVVLANARKYGTGATINPEGKVNDGVFEVVVVKKINFIGLLNMLIAHKPFHKEKVEIVSTNELLISTKSRAYFQVDGEYRGRTKNVKAVIQPKCLHIMLPAAVKA